MRPFTAISFLTALIFSTPTPAEEGTAEFLRNQSETQLLLNGTKLQGTYLRTQSPYFLEFRQDGTLINQRGAQGRWWVNEQGQYCRQWETGMLKGHQACLDLARDGDGIAIYSEGKRVAEGALLRK